MYCISDLSLFMNLDSMLIAHAWFLCYNSLTSQLNSNLLQATKSLSMAVHRNL